MPSLTRRAALGLLTLAGGLAAFNYTRRRRLEAQARALYETPLPRPEGGMAVYHLGHSLVGRDMPAMLAQLAGDGHSYHSQLGWGTSLKEHWEPGLPINGFEAENAHDRFRPASEAIASGTYDSLVLTEMVEIADAIRYHDSATYLAKWAELAWSANPRTRIYLYETWPHRGEAVEWFERLDRDLRRFWQAQIKFPALAETDAPIHLIPAGQVKAAFLRAVADRGGVGEITGADDLFARQADGTPDTIHFNDLGAYLVALTHYAVIYHKAPMGLPHRLNRADGTPAQAPSAEVAALMQQVVWDVVQRHPETGVAA